MIFFIKFLDFTNQIFALPNLYQILSNDKLTWLSFLIPLRDYWQRWQFGSSGRQIKGKCTTIHSPKVFINPIVALEEVFMNLIVALWSESLSAQPLIHQKSVLNHIGAHGSENLWERKSESGSMMLVRWTRQSFSFYSFHRNIQNIPGAFLAQLKSTSLGFYCSL